VEKGASGRVLKNFAVVLRGRGIAAVFTLAATALMANALSATEFGLVILLHTYVLAVRGILNFRTYEAIVRFGVPLHENGEDEGLKRLFRTTTLIDLASGIAATLVGVSAASVAGGFLHWDAQMISVAGLYSLVMLTTISNTPNGILRLYDRFDALSVFYTVGPAIRITGVAIAWTMGAGMNVFIAIWATAFVTAGCLSADTWSLISISTSQFGAAWAGTVKTGRESAKPARSFATLLRWFTGRPILICYQNTSLFCWPGVCSDQLLPACSDWHVIFPAY
jgi:O-antigen/teichoic acid export membrane protein